MGLLYQGEGFGIVFRPGLGHLSSSEVIVELLEDILLGSLAGPQTKVRGKDERVLSVTLADEGGAKSEENKGEGQAEALRGRYTKASPASPLVEKTHGKNRTAVQSECLSRMHPVVSQHRSLQNGLGIGPEVESTTRRLLWRRLPFALR